VVRGQDVMIGEQEAKMAVLLVVQRGERTSVCTGVAINSQTILTAAHCVYGAKPPNVQVRFMIDGNSPTEKESVRQVKQLTIHENYDGSPQSYSDLALVKLVAAVPENYSVLELCDNVNEIADDHVLLVGYGITDELSKDSMRLRRTTKSFKQDLHMKDRFIGIEQTNEAGGFCRGDSGAPVIVKVGNAQKIIGINSFTIGTEPNTECHTASVAMSIPYFAKWIRDNSQLL
jgi:secreted trypsin-like serine protease